MANKIEIIITGDDSKAIAALRNLGRVSKTTTSRMERNGKKIARAWKGLSTSVVGLTRTVFSLKGALVGLGLGFIAKSTLDVAAGFERMAISLETITKGKGAETFEALNEWALRMPVNTEEAMKSFIQLKAMGLDPTLKQMTLLSDTVSALAGSADFPRIARALGQIATKGKVVQQELIQLAEQGIPVMKILQEELGLTAAATASIGDHAISSGRALEAIWKGLAKRFAGQSELIMGTWGGMTETLVSLWKEFQRQVMESGLFAFLKTGFKLAINEIEKLKESGDFSEWAEEVSDTIVDTLERVVLGTASIADSVSGTIREIGSEIDFIWKGFQQLPSWVKQVGIVGALIGGIKGKAVIVGLLHLTQAASNSYKGLTQVLEGNIAASDFATMNAEELAAALEKLRERGIGVRFPIEDLSVTFQNSGEKASTATEKIKDFFEVLREGQKVAKVDRSLTQFFAGIDPEGGFGAGAAAKEPELMFAEGKTIEDQMREMAERAKAAFTEEQTALGGFGIFTEEQAMAELERLDSFTETFTEKWAEMTDASKSDMQKLGEFTAQTLGTVTKGIAKGVADAIVHGKSLGDAMKGVLKQTAASIIQMLIETGIQRLIQHLMGKALITSGVLAEGTAMSSIYAINAMSSVAAIPVWGWAAAPGVGAEALAAGLALTAQATAAAATYGDGGISFRPELAMVGEKGPEAHVPLKGGAIPVNLTGGEGASPQTTQIFLEIGGREILDFFYDASKSGELRIHQGAIVNA